jgi:hypothetical protein
VYIRTPEVELVDRERAIREQQRQAERADRAEAEALAQRHHSAQIDMQSQDTDRRGAEVLRLAQEAARRRRDDDELYRMETDRRRDLPRRSRNTTIFEDDDDRRWHRRN